MYLSSIVNRDERGICLSIKLVGGGEEETIYLISGVSKLEKKMYQVVIAKLLERRA